MFVIGSFEDVEFNHDVALQRSAGNHSFNGIMQNSFGKFSFNDLACGFVFDSAWIASVPVIKFFGVFFAAEFHFFGVDDNDMIAAIKIWREACFMFAAQNFGDN